ncbi:MAG: AMP-binding protein [Bacteroidales bacterium]|nr:AMP-binding protein [Bacteroidales bacterium]
MNVFDYFFSETKTFDKLFVLGPKEQITFNQLYENSLKISKFINSICGTNKYIYLIGPNNVFFITVYLAIFKSGNICVPLNPDIESKNIEFILNICKPEIIFCSESVRQKFEDNHIHIVDDNEINKKLVDFSIADIDGYPDKNFDTERLAEIIFTSGSTGEPKGVMISHKNIIANTNSIINYLQLTTSDIIEVVLPFYYCYGLSLLHTHLKVGGSVVFNNSFMFIGSVINDLKKYKCTGFAGVPSHFQILLRKTKSFKTTDFPDLKYVTQAGGKLHTIFIQEFMEAFKNIKFYVMYGQTEATARLSYLPPELLPAKLGSIGKGIPDVILDVFNEKSESVEPGEIGEIVAKGDNIMVGYLDEPEETSRTIRNGWLYTGDLATKDTDGFIYHRARKKEIIKVGGKRISPKEIEEVILSIPEVVDCTISSISDDILGEAIKAVVVMDKKNQEIIDEKKIKKYCSEKLALYKIPQIIEITDKLKIASTGKKVKSKF